MSDVASSTDWFFREDGVVTTASWDVVDPAPMLRASAYRKTWLGETLTAEEQAAVEAGRGRSALADAATLLGQLVHEAPGLLAEVDAVAAKVAAALALPEALAWSALATYCKSAEGVCAAELMTGGVLSAEPIEALIQEAAAWEASDEGRRAIAALAPDGGPEGWSRVPPTNPDHGCHPSRRVA